MGVTSLFFRFRWFLIFFFFAGGEDAHKIVWAVFNFIALYAKVKMFPNKLSTETCLIQRCRRVNVLATVARSTIIFVTYGYNDGLWEIPNTNL